MQIWLISDTHFFHENMYKFIGWDGVTRTRAKFTSAAEGDEYMMMLGMRWLSQRIMSGISGI